MRSLWVKIFLWFWLAMFLVGGVLVVSVILTRPDHPNGPFSGRPFGPRGPRGPPRPEFTADTLRRNARISAQLLRRGRRPELKRHLDQLERNTGIKATVFDADGLEVSGRPVPDGAQELARQAQESGQAEFRDTEGALLIAQSFFPPRGGGVTIVGQVPAFRSNPFMEPADLILRFLAVLLTGGAVCFWLSRYLTTPLTRLRKASTELAGGDLSVRVGPFLEKRADEFSDLARDFDLMAERIEELVKSQRRLLQDISHELRSPLARLNVSLELVRQQSGAAAGSSLDRIQREAERMNQLIGQLLSLTRLEGDAELIAKEPVDLKALLSEVCSDADFEARNRQRRVRVSHTERCVVMGSADLLRSAVENVIRNAVRYTAEDTEVEVEQRQREPSRVSILVRDRGPGLPEEALTQIFRPFYRVEDARDRESGGVGLGLSIAERIVRLHGGTIAAFNQPTGGLVIEISLSGEIQSSAPA